MPPTPTCSCRRVLGVWLALGGGRERDAAGGHLRCGGGALLLLRDPALGSCARGGGRGQGGKEAGGVGRGLPFCTHSPPWQATSKLCSALFDMFPLAAMPSTPPSPRPLAHRRGDRPCAAPVPPCARVGRRGVGLPLQPAGWVGGMVWAGLERRRADDGDRC